MTIERALQIVHEWIEAEERYADLSAVRGDSTGIITSTYAAKLLRNLMAELEDDHD